MAIEISDPPRLKIEQIETFVQEQYGLVTDAKSLVSDIGQNFRLTDSQGKEFIIKVANASESISMLEAQNAALEHLKSKNYNFRLPELVENLKNEKISQIIGQQGNHYNARVLSYLPGNFLANISPHTDNHMKDLGKLLGNLDKSLQDFDHPALLRYWHWDLKNINDIRQLTTHIKNPAKKRLVDYFIMQFESEVLSKSTQLRRSVIHNDANDHNILVNEVNSVSVIDGIIDFGDMVHSHTIFELAIALAYVMLNKKDPLIFAGSVVHSYHQVLPLLEIEMDVLFYSICARLSQSVTMAAYQKSIQPDNNYVSVTEKSAWSLMDQLIQINPEKAKDLFYRACSEGLQYTHTDSVESILHDRKIHIGESLSISYKKPLNIMRGGLQYLYDHSGETYLDCVNNVCHVGHAHPIVVRAAQQQMAILNTNTRYLHEYLVEYAKRLTETLPDPLQVCFFC